MGRSAPDHGGMCIDSQIIMKMVPNMAAVVMLICLMTCPSVARELVPLRPENMSCSFVQTKESVMLQEKMVSSGRMYFSSPDKVRWEYMEPLSRVFIMNGEEAVFIADGKKQKVDLSKNRMFRGISQVMMLGLSGSPLVSDNDFSVEVRETALMWEVTMTPKKKDMARFMAEVRLVLRKTDCLVTRVTIVEPGGDLTCIELKDIDLQTTADEEKFDVR